jgi:hypothetical protein
MRYLPDEQLNIFGPLRLFLAGLGQMNPRIRL